VAALRKLIKKKKVLVVSLPVNDAKLAQPAVEAGADSIIVHINVQRRANPAYGIQFGSWQEEKGNVIPIAELCVKNNVSIGIMPGSDWVATLEEFDEFVKLGFDFYNIYVYDLPASHLCYDKLSKMIAVGYKYNLDSVKALGELGADFLEAAIIHPEGHEQRLTLNDLTRYKNLVSAAQIPVLVPTQRKISLDDLPALFKTGVHGLIITHLMTGKHAKGIYEVTKNFSKALLKF